MNDAVAAVAWLTTTLLLLWTARLWSRWLFPRDGLRPTTIHVLTLFWACVVGNTLVLGSLGILFPALLLASVCASCLVALAVLRVAGKRGGRSALGEIRAAGEFNGAERSSGGALSLHARQRSHRVRWWTIAWGLLGSLFIARVVLDGLLAFPMEWDSMAYHMPLVDHWLREGTLYVPQCAFWYCPGNNEALGLWMVAPFSGDFLIGLNNLLTVVLLATSVVELVASFGVSRSLCHLSGMAIVATRATWRQMVTAENDVAVAALFLATLVYGVRYARHGKWADVILASAAIGLLSGVKYYAVGYAGVAGLGVVSLVAASRGPRVAMRAAAIGLTGVLLLGGYWYVRNTCATGTPLYPKGFTASTDLWATIRPESGTSTLLGNRRPEVWPLLAVSLLTMAGPCQLVAAFVLPVTLLWLAVSDLKRRGRALGTRRLRGWLLLPIALSALVLLRTPNVVETVPGTMNMLRRHYHPVRFGLCPLSLAVVGLAVLMDDVACTLAGGSRRRTGKSCTSDSSTMRDRGRRACWAMCQAGRWGIHGLWIAGVGYQVAIHSWEHGTLDHVLLASNIFGAGALLWLLVRWSSCERRYVFAVVLCVFASTAWGCHYLAGRWHRGFAQHYNGDYFRTPVLSSLAPLDPGQERICVCDDRYYPFFGSRRQFDVCRPLWVPDFARLGEYLRDREVTLLVARHHDPNPRRRYADVKQWITDHPELFRRFHEDGTFTIVRVDHARLRALEREREDPIGSATKTGARQAFQPDIGVSQESLTYEPGTM